MFRFLASLFLLCAMLAAHALGTDYGDWSLTCSQASISLGELRANCETPPMGPPWICSELDLNNCYGYVTGRGILAMDGGNLGEHCEGCELFAVGDTHALQCQCRDPNGNTRLHSTNSDILIKNDNGYLRCFDHIGTKCEPDKRAVDARRSANFTA